MTEEAAVAAEEPATEPELAELRAALERAEREAVAAKDLARRAQADFANARRRAEIERKEAHSRVLARVGGGFLPVLDDLERAVAGPQSAENADAMLTGVRLVLRRFEETLAQHGFSEVPALGEPFDPRVHEALQRAPAQDGQRDEEVVGVLSRGWTLGDQLVRPASVVVAMGDAPETPGPVDEAAEISEA